MNALTHTRWVPIIDPGGVWFLDVGSDDPGGV